MTTLRAGIVPYLNMFPLVHGLDRVTLPGGPCRRIEVVSLPPALMSQRMDEGGLEIGMVPCGALATRPGWRILTAREGGSMIGSDGAVRSVLVLGAGPPGSWRVLHPDAHSRSSNALIQILLQRAFGLPPPAPGEPAPLTGWEPPAKPVPGEAWVLIGTRALRWSREWERRGGTVLDMGAEWTRWTGLPFVFAVWAAREGVDPDAYNLPGWMEVFERVKRDNQARLPELLAAHADLTEERITPDEAHDYLTRNIRFDLDERAMRGFERYAAEGRALGIF